MSAVYDRWRGKRADTEHVGDVAPCQGKRSLTLDCPSEVTDKGPETQRVSMKPSRAGIENGERGGERLCILPS